MKRFGFSAVLFVCFTLLASFVFARNQTRNSPRENYRMAAPAENRLNLDNLQPGETRLLTAEADTFVLGSWDFDTGAFCDPQGWISMDRTAQDGCYFHIDDFLGLGGGDFGRLVPLQGTQSLWCGARPDSASSLLCDYAALPGYGNHWDQGWCFDCIEVPDTEAVSIDYIISWDTEPGYDYVYVEYATKSTCDSLQSIDDIYYRDWVELCKLDNIGMKQLRSDTIPAGHRGAVKIRFHFISDIAWSDEDGIWGTDGAVIVDSVTVRSASVLYDYEDFEDEAPGDLSTTDGDWECCVRSGFGDYAGLYRGITLLQEDPCNVNLTCMWSFINGSTDNYACGGYPGQTTLPYGEDPDYLLNEIWSPIIDWQGIGSQVELQFDVYRDLDMYGLIFYEWHVRSIVNECPHSWRNRDFIYWGDKQDWFTDTEEVSDLINPDASQVQIALGARDMCKEWCGLYGFEVCHSHAPLFDNVRLSRITSNGPVWYVDPVHLFQDNFASDGTLTGTVRADMAGDIMPYYIPTLRPGDSVVVNVSDLENGIGTCPAAGGPAVYLYAAVRPKFQAGKTGEAMSGDPSRWPLVDSLTAAGNNWYVFRMDTVFKDETGAREDPVANQFCVDLNDNLFVPGDTVYFFFKATSGSPANNTTYWSEFTGTNTSLLQVAEDAMEFTCLPAGRWGELSSMLYVDNYDGLGAEPFFDLPIAWLGLIPVDRYDVRGPGSSASNGIGGRVVDVSQQLISRYNVVIWNSGDLRKGTVGDGTGNPSKSDDYGVLYEFLDQHTRTYGSGVYMSGDNIASELNNLTGSSAQSFRDNFIPHTLIADDHKVYCGTSPMVIGVENSCFDLWSGYWGPDTLIAFGGCPDMNSFDVLDSYGTSTVEMTYEHQYGPGAVIRHETINSLGNPAGVFLSGFSFHRIREDRPCSSYGCMDRIGHLRHIIQCFHFFLDEVDAVDDMKVWKNLLAQNYPNPFNPTTTIRYSIKEHGHVSLKVYDVAGRLVKTLVNEVKQPGMMHEVRWSGRSNAGDPVASGVYFYKMVMKDFTKTRKLVLLK